MTVPKAEKEEDGGQSGRSAAEQEAANRTDQEQGCPGGPSVRPGISGQNTCASSGEQSQEWKPRSQEGESRFPRS